ncbi:GNAT family N-acetyltransferase [Geomicrobium sp. JCM 19055]|uniref:GNAT family N-acetyltransferase n=1 Tax=Geomicrobium sp. JCM 19055 TaxID=1460649 RepID=UPI00045ECFFE|nr:GNAT family N-acetyltransferase [Geomicrobium sp. JCM 19055]GAJ97579.1 negative regulation of sporulation, septation and degradative enzyme [Geomicrobium sp. JCM 19055]
MTGISAMRRCEPSDVEALRSVSIDTFVETFASQNEPVQLERHLERAFAYSKLELELQEEQSEFYVIDEGNEFQALLKLNVGAAQSEPFGEDYLEIERIYIRSSNQGQGIGRALLEFAFQRAKELNKMYVWLGVWEKNLRAKQVYERLGFTAFDEHYFYFGEEQQRDILMKRSSE